MKVDMITESVMSPCSNYCISIKTSAILISVICLLHNTGIISTSHEKKNGN